MNGDKRINFSPEKQKERKIKNEENSREKTSQKLFEQNMRFLKSISPPHGDSRGQAHKQQESLSPQEVSLLQGISFYPIRTKSTGRIREYRIGGGDPSSSIYAFADRKDQNKPLYFTNDRDDKRYARKLEHYVPIYTYSASIHPLELLSKREALAYFRRKKQHLLEGLLHQHHLDTPSGADGGAASSSVEANCQTISSYQVTDGSISNPERTSGSRLSNRDGDHPDQLRENLEEKKKEVTLGGKDSEHTERRGKKRSQMRAIQQGQSSQRDNLLMNWSSDIPESPLIPSAKHPKKKRSKIKSLSNILKNE